MTSVSLYRSINLSQINCTPTFYSTCAIGHSLLEQNVWHNTGQKTKAFIDTVGFPGVQSADLKTLLHKVQVMPENQEVAREIQRACYKQRGFFSRLFSRETWGEWSEHRTSLGRVLSVFRECLETQTKVSLLVRRLDRGVVRKAEEEARALLGRLRMLEVVREEAPAKKIADRKWVDVRSVSSCAMGVVSGAIGTAVTQNPLPMLMGLGGCLPIGRAQIPIGSDFQVNTPATYSAPASIRFPGLYSYTHGAEIFMSTNAITTLNNGNFVVTWGSCVAWENNCARIEILGQMYDATGSEIGGNFQVNTFQANPYSGPAITALNNGNFVIMWSGNTASRAIETVIGQMYDATGSEIGGKIQVGTLISYNIAITSLNNGNFVVVWSDGGISGQIYDDTGSAIGGNFQIGTCPADVDSAAITTLNNGDCVVVWSCTGVQGQMFGEVQGQMFGETGSLIGGAIAVSTSVATTLTVPGITALNNNHFVVMWIGGCDSSGLGCEVYGQIYDDTGSVFGSTFQVSSSSVGTSAYIEPIAISTLSNGNFVVVWGCASFFYGVLGQMYDTTGSMIGGAFQIFGENGIGFTGLAITALSNGDFVVVDSSLSAQIFSSNLISTPSPITIPVGASLGGAVFLLVATKVASLCLSSRNFKKALVEYDSSTNQQFTRVLATRIFKKIDTTNCIGYRGYNKTVAYMQAIGKIGERLGELGVNVNLGTSETAQQTIAIDEIAQLTFRCTTSPRKCGKPRVTPSQIEERASLIALAAQADFPSLG